MTKTGRPPTPHVMVRTCDGPVEGKVCTYCKRALPLRCFTRTANSADGLRAWCNECPRKMRRKSGPGRSFFEDF